LEVDSASDRDIWIKKGPADRGLRGAMMLGIASKTFIGLMETILAYRKAVSRR
jgi:hypothetical protein